VVSAQQAAAVPFLRRGEVPSASGCSASRSRRRPAGHGLRGLRGLRLREGLDNSFRDAPVFNGLITFLMISRRGGDHPWLPRQVILVAQSLNGILLPVIPVFTLLLINDRA
jgi:hypothetical protein